MGMAELFQLEGVASNWLWKASARYAM